MLATHRVKDSTGETVGFIVGGEFYNVYSIRKHISLIDNLSVTRRGTFRAKRALPVIDYTKSVGRQHYKRVIAANPFRRDIQRDLLDWKKNPLHKVLQLQGTRQIGKTTELAKFAYSNYDYVIMVTLTNSKQLKEFRWVLDNNCTPMAMDMYCSKMNLPPFVNSRRTILIVDEIQRDKDIYNAIRTLADNVNCDIVVTGSYLGRTLSDPSFFKAAGTVDTLEMFNMSFKEFCRVFNSETLLETIDIFGGSNKSDYAKLNSLYELYCKIGGYPEIVKIYKREKSIQKCYDAIGNLLHIFEEESRAYLKSPRDVAVFNSVYRASLSEMCKRQVLPASNNSNKLILEIASSNNENIVNKRDIGNAIVWLSYCGILSTCDFIEGKDIKKSDNILKKRRVYFSDCGLLSYLASINTIEQSAQTGLTAETFVFNELHRLYSVKYSNRQVKNEDVCYSTSGTCELDFIVTDMNNITYGIEVKAKDGDPKSLKHYISNGFIHRGIVAKPSTGGHGEKFDTIPIYTVAARFPYL